MERSKAYFVSDAHFGADSLHTSELRERWFVDWLEEIKNDAAELYLLGDIFDFWFEYKYVVPRGFVAVLAKLNELANSGVKITYFTGNHDMWIFDYLPKILSAQLFKQQEVITINGKVFFLAHGDGLGTNNRMYNLMKRVFRNKFFQFLFKSIHPDIGCKIASFCSKTTKKKYILKPFEDLEKERLVFFSRKELEKKDYDFFIFGHRHVAFQYKLTPKSLFTNTGDWLNNFTYAVFDGEKLELKKYECSNNRPL